MANRWNFMLLAASLSFGVLLSRGSCPRGYSFMNNSCNDQDECEIDEDYSDIGPCGENARCINTVGSFYCQCEDGFTSSSQSKNFSAETPETCRDVNECLENHGLCGPNAACFNTIPYYSCICIDGFISSTKVENFHDGDNVTCIDIDECQEDNICGENATCINTQGSFHCVCNAGFGLKSGKSTFSKIKEQCQDICIINKTICGNGICHRGAHGHFCACQNGFTDFANNGSHCTALNCDVFEMNNEKKTFNAAHEFLTLMKKSCLELPESENPTALGGYDMLEKLLSLIDKILSSGALKDNRKVSTFLDLVEIALKFISPLINPPRITKTSNLTDLIIQVHKGTEIPQGVMTLSSKKVQLDIQSETAAGHPSSYPGFTSVSFLTYENLEDSVDGFFSGMNPHAGESFKINSKVTTVVVSNSNTSQLKEPVNLTFHHPEQLNEFNHTCVFWDSSEDGGTWSPRGCSVVETNPNYTVCSCNHLSSFAVLMSVYEIEDRFELKLITWLGLSLSLICFLFCILTFSLIRSIQSPRTTIHLHLCISLFIATLIFLAGISHTENQVGCALVAGLLHFFYLAAFCWMCLEGIQLFRMVVLVFNTNFKIMYMLAGGYGVPAVIVGISALANSSGYGTKRYCWLKLEFIWSFVGPACVIIIVNVFFFFITVWKLAQKFSSLNPDLDTLQKIRAFTVTAVAQLCVLGTMWIFGCFQFGEGTIIMSYLFTFFGSLQGVMLFVMHCLFSKQVRDEYRNILSRFCVPKKKKYSEFSCSHSSKAHASKSTQETGESNI